MKKMSIRGTEIDFMKLRMEDKASKAVKPKLANKRSNRKSVKDLLAEQAENVRKVRESMAKSGALSNSSLEQESKPVPESKKITKIVKK